MTAKGGGSGFWGTSYILLQPYLKRFDRYLAELDPALSKAGLRITYKAYVAGMVIASVLGVVGGIIASRLENRWYKQ